MEEVKREFPSGVDWNLWYLDDGVIVGDAEAVDLFYRKLVAAFAAKGLEIADKKCQLIPAGGKRFIDDPNLFPGVPRIFSRNFKLLGAPFGDGTFSDALTRKRIGKVRITLDEVAKMSNAQGALTILRNSGGFNKLGFSARTRPTHLIAPALGTLSSSMRSTLCDVMGTSIEDDSWHLAPLPYVMGALGSGTPVPRGGSLLGLLLGLLPHGSDDRPRVRPNRRGRFFVYRTQQNTV